jgi:hypothetical protein
LVDPFPGAGLALEEEVWASFTGLLSAAGEADIVALVSEEVLLETGTPPVFSSSELSELLSEEELELSELEDSGSGVLTAFFRTFASAFLVASASESDESEESEESESELELELELDELLELESEPESESELDSDEDSALETLAFFVLGASSSDSESELDSEELLDSALRLTPAGFLAAGAGVGAAASSSSSSASLSELEEEDDGDAERALGASPMLTSESLESLSLSLLPLSELLLEPLEILSHVWKSSTKDGAFLASVLALPFFFSSSAKAVLVAEKPFLERKDATAASN